MQHDPFQVALLACLIRSNRTDARSDVPETHYIVDAIDLLEASNHKIHQDTQDVPF